MNEEKPRNQTKKTKPKPIETTKPEPDLEAKPKPKLIELKPAKLIHTEDRTTVTNQHTHCDTKTSDK